MESASILAAESQGRSTPSWSSKAASRKRAMYSSQKDGATALDTVCVVRTPLDVVLLSSVAILRPDQSQIIASFLRFYLEAPATRDYMKRAFTTGAAIPRVVLRDFKQAKIRFPPVQLQEKICGILSAYDDLIENSLRRIQILEEMAQALYREWFVEFRFPGHGSQASEAGSEDLPPGWETKRLDEVAELVMGTVA